MIKIVINMYEHKNRGKIEEDYTNEDFRRVIMIFFIIKLNIYKMLVVEADIVAGNKKNLEIFICKLSCLQR